MNTLPERVSTLEERTIHINKKLDENGARLDEIYELIQKGKGAKWAFVLIASLISCIIGLMLRTKVPLIPF